MKSACPTGLNAFIERLLSALHTSRREQQKHLARDHAEAAKKAREHKPTSIKKSRLSSDLANQDF
jgi:hypothetical protein